MVEEDLEAGRNQVMDDLFNGMDEIIAIRFGSTVYFGERAIKKIKEI